MKLIRCIACGSSITDVKKGDAGSRYFLRVILYDYYDFQPKLYKTQLLSEYDAFRRRFSEEINEIRPKFTSDEQSDNVESSEDVLSKEDSNSTIDGTNASCDYEADDSVIEDLESLSVSDAVSTVSTLPGCHCGLKMKLNPDNVAVCAKIDKPCSQKIDLSGIPNVAKFN